MPRYSLLLGAALVIAVAAHSSAQPQTPPDPGAAANVRQSQQYESLVCSNAAFRAKRIQQECGPISDPQLHQSCLATFDCGGAAPKARNWRKAPASETVR